MSFRLPLFHISWRRTVQGIAALSLLGIAIGGLYQTVSLFRERSAFPMPGRLVDVGGSSVKSGLRSFDISARCDRSVRCERSS